MTCIRFLCVVLFVFLTACTSSPDAITSTPITEATALPIQTAVPATVTSTPTEILTLAPTDTPTPESTLTPTAVPTHVLAESPTPEPFTTTAVIGQSANGTDITVTKLGSSETAVLLIGGLHAGFAPATVSLAEEIVAYYSENNQALPADVTLYVVTNANPDSVVGEAGEMNGRLNGNGVDLNRNWDCQWGVDAQWHGQPISGGDEPFSEPETQALRDFILHIEPQTVIAFEAKGGLVAQGMCNGRSVSEALTAIYAEATGYDPYISDPIDISGDMTDWLNSQNIPAIAPLLPDYTEIDWEKNLAGIEAALTFAVEQKASAAEAENRETPAPSVQGNSKDLMNNTGMTWGKVSHDDALAIDMVGCYGTPRLDGTTDGSPCNPYQGDTSCSEALPILCLNVEDLPRPNYAVTGEGHAMSQEFYRGWSGGYIGLTAPILGAELTSREAANAFCVQALGNGYRIASHHDGKYVPSMDLDQFFGATWPAPEDLYTGGWHWYTYGNISGESRFWVEIADQPGNCWNSGASHQPLTTIPTPTTIPTDTPLLGSSDDEYAALVALYMNLDGENWQSSNQWLQTEDYCTWHGVTCTNGHVTKLDFYENWLTGDMPSEIGNLANLTDLALAHNNLSSLPPEIGNLANLTDLYLYGNNLSSLPPEIGNLTNLTVLYLYDNNLSSLPPEIGNLKNLTDLYLSDNNLSSLPPEIGNLANLTDLDLTYNNLSSLPPEIGNLTNLTELGLGLNNLSNLPPEIGNLANLISLSLWDNNLSSLPPEIGNLTNLTHLDLANNNLSSLPPEVVNLTNLTELWLSNNNLSSLPPEVVNLTNLTELRLSDNNLSSLPPEIGNLTNLTHLDLTYNNLSSLPPEIGNLKNLTDLYLSDNNLSSLPPELCAAFPDGFDLNPASLCSP